MSTQTVAQNKHLVIRETTKQSKLAKSALRGSVLPVVVLIAWQALGSVGILPAQLFSSPLLIVMTFIDLVQSGEMGMHLQISLTRAFLGFALGGFLGLLLGVIVGMQKNPKSILTQAFKCYERFLYSRLRLYSLCGSGLVNYPKCCLLL